MTLNLCFIIANDKYEPSLRNLRGAEADGRVLVTVHGVNRIKVLST
jgi:hypothetical protein